LLGDLTYNPQPTTILTTEDAEKSTENIKLLNQLGDLPHNTQPTTHNHFNHRGRWEKNREH